MEFENELSGEMGCESEGKVHTLENVIRKCKEITKISAK